MSDIVILDSFSSDVDEFCNYLNSLSNNSILFYSDIKKIKNEAHSIPKLQNNSGISLDSLLTELDDLDHDIKNFFLDFPAEAFVMSNTTQMLRDRIGNVENSVDREKILRILKNVITAYDELKTYIKNGELTDVEKEMLSSCIDEEGNVTNWEQLITLCSQLCENYDESNSENVEHLVKFGTKLTKELTKEAAGSDIKSYLGRYGLGTMELIGGIVFEGKEGWIDGATDLLQEAFNSFIERERLTKTAVGQMDEDLIKSILKNNSFLKKLGPTFAATMIVTCIADAVDGGDMYWAKDLTSAVYSTLAFEVGMAVGTAIGGPLMGAGTAAVLDFIGTLYIDSEFKKWEAEEDLRNFSDEDLSKLEFDNVSMGIIDDERLKSGTTVFDAEKYLKDLGFSEYTTRYLTSELLGLSFRNESHDYIPPDLAAILDFNKPPYTSVSGGTPTKNIYYGGPDGSMHYSTAELDKYNEIMKLLKNGKDKELGAYSEFISDNYYASIQRARMEERNEFIDNLRTDLSSTNIVSSERPI